MWRRFNVPKRAFGLWFRCWSARVGSGCRERLALLCPGPFACPTGRSYVRASADATGHLLAVRALCSLRSPGPVPGRPRSASSSTRAHQLSVVVSAPCVVSGSGRSRSKAPPAGTGFRQGGGALSCCGCVGGGGVRLGALSLPGTLRADQEPDGDASGGGYRCVWGCFSPLASPSEPWYGGPARQGQSPQPRTRTARMRSPRVPRRTHFPGPG